MRILRCAVAGALVLGACTPAHRAPVADTGPARPTPASERPAAADASAPQVRADGKPVADRAALAALDLERVRAGQAWVPRVRVGELPARLTEIDDVERRKRVFVRTLLPAILRANRRVQRQRDFLRAIDQLELAPGQLSAPMHARLARLAERYGTAPDQLDRLLRRVDTLPPGLVLAQAALETGWGTSRFAQQGNALFGEHTDDPDHAGLAPRGLDNPDFRVRAFDTLSRAVAAYMHNLNTHPAYAQLRRIRARARADGDRPTGVALAAGLEDYSARGRAYIEDVRVTIRANEFDRYHRARLTPRVRSVAGPVPQVADRRGERRRNGPLRR